MDVIEEDGGYEPVERRLVVILSCGRDHELFFFKAYIGRLSGGCGEFRAVKPNRFVFMADKEGDFVLNGVKADDYTGDRGLDG